MVSINTNDTTTCIVGETLCQKVQSLQRVCVFVHWGGGWGVGGRQLEETAQRKCSVLDWFERV